MVETYKTRGDYKALPSTVKASITRSFREYGKLDEEFIYGEQENTALHVASFRRKLASIIADHTKGDTRGLLDAITITHFGEQAFAVWVRISLRAQEINEVTADSTAKHSASIEGRIVVVSAEHLSPGMRFQDRRFAVTGGFGAQPNARGSAIFGKWMATGEETRIERFMVSGFAQVPFEDDACETCGAEPKPAELVKDKDGRTILNPANVPTKETGFVDIDLANILDDIAKPETIQPVSLEQEAAEAGYDSVEEYADSDDFDSEYPSYDFTEDVDTSKVYDMQAEPGRWYDITHGATLRAKPGESMLDLLIRAAEQATDWTGATVKTTSKGGN